MNDPRGSIWRKWDLHIHTPFSYLNNSFGNFDDEYVQKLFRLAIENDIAVIGITDYYCIEGYKHIREYLLNTEKMKALFTPEEITKINNILILPNIEFRINVIINDSKVNFHILFSDKVSIRDIEEHFLHDIEFDYEGNPQGRNERRKLKLDNLCDLGQRLKKEHTTFEGKDDIFVGMVNAFVEYGEVIQILQNGQTKFKDKYLIGVPSDEDLSEIHWDNGSHLSRKLLIQSADFLFAANPNTIKWAIGSKNANIDEFKKEFKSLKPCLHGSDAHDYDKLFKPDGDRYCWIKADPTFEGLRQIFYEPELRVKIQEGNPSETETYTKIGSASIILRDDVKIRDESKNETKFCFSGKHEIALSNNLTCIIGGRGTGKSTLAHMIYNVSNQDSNLLTKIGSPLINVCLGASPLSTIADLTDCIVPSNTEFFFQNAIEKYASNIDEISNLITHRLINLSAINGKCLSELIEEWKEPHELIQDIIEAYDKVNALSGIILRNGNEIETLKKQTEVVLSEGYKNLQDELKKLSQELSNLDFYEQTYRKAKEETSKLNKYIAGLKWDDGQGNNLLSEFIGTIEKFLGDLEAKYETYIEKNNKEEIKGRVDAKKDELKEFLNKMGLEEENVEELATANQKIAKLESQNISLEEEIQPYKEIHELKDEVIGDYKGKYLNYKDRYQEVCLSFMLKLKDIEIPNKKIDFDVGASDANMRHVIVQFIKEELSEESGLKADAIEKRIFDEIKAADSIGDINKLKGHILAIEDSGKNIQFLKILFSKASFVEKLILRMVKSYYDVDNLRVNTKYGGNVLRNTSFGERCGIVLAMVLSAGTNPIVIDQPEDHLGGRFISEILVPLIRKQKNNRQIILITRDANIVIGSDAELINILEVKNQLTTISPATIENLTQRENYIWVLDGGKDAFLKRENKYNLKAGD